MGRITAMPASTARSICRGGGLTGQLERGVTGTTRQLGPRRVKQGEGLRRRAGQGPRPAVSILGEAGGDPPGRRHQTPRASIPGRRHQSEKAGTHAMPGSMSNGVGSGGHARHATLQRRSGGHGR